MAMVGGVWSWSSTRLRYAARMSIDLTALPGIIEGLDPQLNDRLSPLTERGKVALYLALRARLGHERVSLHTSRLVDAQGQDLASPRYVVRVGEQFLTEHDSGPWEQYPRVALKRARTAWKRRAAKVVVGQALKLSQLAPEETDTRVVRRIQTALTQRGQG